MPIDLQPPSIDSFAEMFANRPLAEPGALRKRLGARVNRITGIVHVNRQGQQNVPRGRR
jgi:hypothetical protein